LLKKDTAAKWIEDFHQDFDRIKEYLSSLLLYLSMSDSAFGSVLGQHDETGKKEQEIYYLSKKFTPYEAWYNLYSALVVL